jgi:hypothetical protein
MNLIRPLSKIFLFLLVLSTGLLANAQSTNDAPTTDFSSFQIVVDRNIFNPNRYPHGPGFHISHYEVPAFSLAGTMSYRKGMFAFFSGTSDDYQKVLQQGGSIAGYKVGKITFDGVQLQTATTNIDMKVGAAMRQEGGGWELNEPGQWGESPVTPAESGNSQNTQTTGETSAPAPSSAAPNDILKRMMEQRAQQEQESK